MEQASTQPEQSLAQTVLRNSATVLVAQLAVKVLSFAFSVLIVRRLGPEVFGQYTAAAAFGGIFLFVADLGLGVYGVREFARLRASSAAQPVINQLFGNVLALRFALSWAATALILITAFVTGRSWWLIGAIALNALGLIMYSVQATSSLALAGYERFGVASRAQIVNQAIFMVLGGLALWAGVGMYGLIGAALVGIAVFSWLCWRAVRELGVRPARPTPRTWLSLLRLSIPFGIASLALGLSYRFDTVLLEVTRSSAETGYYNVAYNLIFSAMLLSNVVNTSLYPSLASRTGGDSAMLSNVYQRMLRYLMAFSLPLAVGAYMLAPQFMHLLYGERNEAAIPIFQILIWVVPFMYASEFLGYVVIVKGLERKGVRSLLISTACNVLINLFLVPRYGYYAAAVVTVVTEIVLVLQYLWLLRDELRHFNIGMVLLRPLIVAACTAIAILVTGSLPFVASVAAGVAVTMLALLALKLIGKQELRLIRPR